MIQFKYPQWIWTFYVSRDYRNFVRFDKINVCCHRHAKNWKLLNEFKTSARAGKRMLLCVWVSVEANQSNIVACFHSIHNSIFSYMIAFFQNDDQPRKIWSQTIINSITTLFYLKRLKANENRKTIYYSLGGNVRSHKRMEEKKKLLNS